MKILVEKDDEKEEEAADYKASNEDYEYYLQYQSFNRTISSNLKVRVLISFVNLSKLNLEIFGNSTCQGKAATTKACLDSD